MVSGSSIFLVRHFDFRAIFVRQCIFQILLLWHSFWATLSKAAIEDVFRLYCNFCVFLKNVPLVYGLKKVDQDYSRYILFCFNRSLVNDNNNDNSQF